MTHDPMQTYSTLGAYPGVTNPFGLPYTALQTSGIHPAAINPLAAGIGYSPVLQGGGYSPFGQQGFGIHPQLLQNPWVQNPLIYAGLQNPLGLQNPIMQNPILQNPLLQNPLLQQNPIQAHLQAQLAAHQLAAQHAAQQLAAQQLAVQHLVAQQLAAQQLAAQQFGQQQPYGGHFQGGQSPFGQVGSPFGQIGSPFGQIGSPYGQVGNPWAQGVSFLAPQTWVGQGGQLGGGIGYGQQLHPLAYLGARGIQGGGVPWQG
jgi:hypothetical protein